MNKIEKDTRSKILDVAQELFAQKGFDGTSVRDIAKGADVNVAAINYHFTNKARLYWEVNMASHVWLEEGLAKLAKKDLNIKDLNIKDLSWALFEYFIEESHLLKNAFMMFLSDSTPELDPEIATEMAKSKEDFGPPGGQYLFAAIDKEIGDEVPFEGKLWAVKSIFSVVMHWSLVMSTSYCKEIYKDHPDFQLENKKKFILAQVEAALQYIQNHPENWQ